MRKFTVTVIERVQKVYEVEARNTSEAAIAVSEIRKGDDVPQSTTVLDARMSQPKVVKPVGASEAAEPENEAGFVK